VAFVLQPLARDAFEALQIRVGGPNPERAMLARGARIVRAPREAGEHLLPMVLLDRGAACDAGEMRVLRMKRIERGLHVLPFENLHVPATVVRARHVWMLLTSGFKIPRDATAGHHERR